MEHMLALHDAVPLVDEQIDPQAPQLDASLVTRTSQPLPGTRSQSA